MPISRFQKLSVQFSCMFVASVVLLASAEAAEPMNPNHHLTLQAKFAESNFTTGDTIKPLLTIRNTTSRRVRFTCMQPLIGEPVVSKGGQRLGLAFAPYNKIEKSENVSLEPGSELVCEATPVVLHEGTLDYKTQSNKPTAFWQAVPGRYKIKYKVELTGGEISGTLQSAESTISVISRNARSKRDSMAVQELKSWLNDTETGRKNWKEFSQHIDEQKRRRFIGSKVYLTATVIEKHQTVAKLKSENGLIIELTLLANERADWSSKKADCMVADIYGTLTEVGKTKIKIDSAGSRITQME